MIVVKEDMREAEGSSKPSNQRTVRVLVFVCSLMWTKQNQ